MNIENLFTILLHSPIHQIIKFIISNINNVNNDYLWKLIYIRKYKTNNILVSYDSYLLYHTPIYFKKKMIAKMDIYQLINLQKFNIHYKLHNLPSEIGQLINLQK